MDFLNLNFLEQQTNIIILDLFGNSLTNIITYYKILSLKTVLVLVIQIIKRIETLHNKCLLHRDIKPSNFVFGNGNDTNKIFLIDLGFSKRYDYNGKHIEEKRINHIIGSTNFVSLNIHNYIEPSRRDDLESLAYMLIFFYNGKLEWQYDFCNDTIIEKKEKILVEPFLYPAVLIDYIKYTRLLNFEDNPNYLYLINMFKKEMEKL